MSKTAIIVLVVIVIALIAGGIWWWSSRPLSSETPGGTAGNGTGGSGLTASGDLNANLTQIDGEMSGFSSDSASMDRSMNDQPVDQEQF